MTDDTRLFLKWLAVNSVEPYLPDAANAWLRGNPPDWQDLALLLAEAHNPALPAIPARLMQGVRDLAEYVRGKEDA